VHNGLSFKRGNGYFHAVLNDLLCPVLGYNAARFAGCGLGEQKRRRGTQGAVERRVASAARVIILRPRARLDSSWNASSEKISAFLGAPTKATAGEAPWHPAAGWATSARGKGAPELCLVLFARFAHAVCSHFEARATMAGWLLCGDLRHSSVTSDTAFGRSAYK
jgi:hypothetical protein